MTTVDFQLEKRLPKRGATDALRRQLRDYLAEHRPPVGAPLMTDAELCDRFQLSRSSVRRAMTQLSDEGWIDRQVGRGTFVGPRVAMGAPSSEQKAPPATAVSASSLTRLAVVVFWDTHLVANWYTPELLRGIGSVAQDHNVAVELINYSAPDPDSVLKRLEQNRPDVVAFPTGDIQELMVIRDAQRLKLPMIVTGTKFASLGLPSVVEDNQHAIDLAMDHLVEYEHREIALALPAVPVPFTFERQRAFIDSVKAHQLPEEKCPTHWVDSVNEPKPFEQEVEYLTDFLRSRRPSALICGNSTVLKAAGEAVARLGWKIPEDLSLIAIDQPPEAAGWLRGINPTTVEIPLVEMGQKVAEYANLIHRDLLPRTGCRLPCRLRKADSVAQPAAASGRQSEVASQ
ncbi:MAG: GntR family transcriptional regulator [Planctomycetota bacterium]